MRRLSEFLMVPFAIFVVVVLLLVVAFKLFSGTTHFVANVILSLINYITSTFAEDLISLFSSSVMIVALPIAAGSVIFLWQMMQHDNSRPTDSFVRGRRLEARRPGSSRSSSGRPSSQPIDQPSLPRPSTRPNRRPRA